MTAATNSAMPTARGPNLCDVHPNPPVLRSFDERGQRLDEIIHHPAYVEMQELGLSRFGFAAMSHREVVLGEPDGVVAALVHDGDALEGALLDGLERHAPAPREDLEDANFHAADDTPGGAEARRLAAQTAGGAGIAPSCASITAGS